MKYFVDSLTSHIKTQINKLKTDHPAIYKYPTDMTSIVYSNNNPADSKSYIGIYQVGETRQEYNSIIYNVAVRINYKGTLKVEYRDFYHICKGIRDRMTYCNNKDITDIDTIGGVFKVIETISLNGITPYKLDNNSYYCEMLFSCKVDIVSIADETLELV
jgi:hypothetical protein